MSADDGSKNMESKGSDKKPGEEPATKPVEGSAKANYDLRVRTNGLNEKQILEFRCKHSTPVSQVMKVTCKKHGIPYGTLKFLFDGERLDPDSTLKYTGLNDMDLIGEALHKNHNFAGALILS